MSVDYSPIYDALKRRLSEHAEMLEVLSELVAMCDEKVTSRQTHQIGLRARLLLERVARDEAER